MRSHLPLAIVLLAVAASCCGAAPAAPGRPNIILVMTDDQGLGDLGVTGNPVLRTPNLDAMAARSARMSRFYVSPVCTPTRASLMTGRHNYRTRAIDTWIGRAMMEPEEVTIAEVLREAGYATGIFGKWHLGDCYPMRPIDQGFEVSLVHRGGGLAQPSEPLENNRRYTDPILWRNGEPVQAQGFCTDVYFDAAIGFAESARESGRPFFAYIATNAPHTPLHDVPEALREKYASKDLHQALPPGEKADARTLDRLARIFAMIGNVDENIGRLFDGLTRAGAFENTIVLFMMDNGPNTRRYVGPLRGMKTHVHEGGIRSVCFLHWPAALRPGASSDVPAAHFDVMPTLLDAAGIDIPAGLRLDGRSFLPLLRGEEDDWPPRTICIQAHRGDVPIPRHHFATIGRRYKLVHPTGFGPEAVDPDATPYELYDIIADPGEAHDLAADHPEIVAGLLAEYDAWFADVAATRPDTFARPRIVIGTPHERITTLTRQDWLRTAGGGWGTQGRWLLTVAREAVFDAEIILREAGPERPVTLCVGEARWEGRIPANANKARLNGLALPAGPAELWVEVAGDPQRGAYQVILYLQ
jgi:arylsulfatase/arylsulfatase A